MSEPKPRYISYDGHLYVSKEHMAEQIQIAMADAVISNAARFFRELGAFGSAAIDENGKHIPLEEIVTQ